MSKSTGDLEKILESTHMSQISDYMEDNKEELFEGDRLFTDYMRDTIRLHGKTQQRIFIDADLSEKYGYKLISGEKHTVERDVILRLCYAAEFTLKETQTALKLYGMSELYAKVARDALIMVAFNERPGSVIEVNSYLIANKMAPLKSSGVQE